MVRLHYCALRLGKTAEITAVKASAAENTTPVIDAAKLIDVMQLIG
jgi:hypothetical protein